MRKMCNRCENFKHIFDFTRAPSNKDGRTNTCKPCVVERNREYWRTPVGRMSYIYQGQLQSSKERGHAVPAYSPEALTMWAFSQGLEQIVETWAKSGYSKNFAPSVDRLNPNLGYSFENIRLVTWKTNNDKAYQDRKSCTHVTRQCRRVEQLTLNGEHVAYFASIAAAGRATGIQRTNINAMCMGKPAYKSVGGFLWQHA